jgi:ribosomal protein L16 Arg81 hydroxylase
VDVESPNLIQFPHFAEIEWCWESSLTAGQMLFIPQGMWHHVRSLTRSISISFWWGDAKKES